MKKTKYIAHSVEKSSACELFMDLIKALDIIDCEKKLRKNENY